MSGPSACEGVRSRLLEGTELDELRAIERAHLDGCAGCRAALARVESGIAALAEGIEAIEPGLSADEAVALATGSGSRVFGWGPSRGVDPATSGRRRLARFAGPAVALAAAILGIVWAGPWRPEDGVRPPPQAPITAVRGTDAVAPGGLSVEAPETGGVAVFATREPDLHVVWFYEDRSSSEGVR